MPVDSAIEGVRNGQGERVAAATEKAARGAWSRGGSINTDSTGYPHTINPDATIYELLVLESGDTIEMEITTTSGDTFSFQLRSLVATFDSWEIDSVTVTDPSGTGDTTEIAWSGEENV